MASQTTSSASVRRVIRPSRTSEQLTKLEWISDQVSGLAVALKEEITAERIQIYTEALSDIPEPALQRAFWRAIRQSKFFPKISELRDFAGYSVHADRPGPEEAWARMPKGERLELDTVVWCEEERAAYNACRLLLIAGNEIAARMTFLERYRRELDLSTGQRVRWAICIGLDREDRMLKLSEAVTQGKVSADLALNFVPIERQEDFGRMLPPGKVKGLLGGKAIPNLPGLPGLLQKLNMDIKPPARIHSAPLTEQQVERRRAILKKQAASLSKGKARA